MTAGPGTQRPAPSHERAPTTESPLHMPCPHDVPAVKRRHAPAPSHMPSKPHVVGSAFTHDEAWRGGAPDERNVHVPGFVPAHVLHDSVQAVLQQTPSTQKLLAHWPL